MAKRQPDPPPIETKKFSLAEVDSGINKIQRRIEEVRRLGADSIKFDDARVGVVRSNIKESIREVFGGNSPEFQEHQHHDIWKGGYNLMESDYARQAKFVAGIPDTVTVLEGLIARLEEKKADMISHGLLQNLQPLPKSSRRVFVVHGHDGEAKVSVARFLEQLRLEPVVLTEEANEGRTIIEKFEHHADVSFAVVLLTPDDAGAESGASPRPRARQNVILELGYFIGRLGRSNVCALYKGGVELPSDIHGVLYVPMDAGDGWKLKLAKELRAAKLEVDLNLAV